MLVTRETFLAFVGGEVEVQNPNPDGHLYRGEVLDVVIEDDGTLRISFSWLVQGEGFPKTIKWVMTKKKEIQLPLTTFGISDIGPSEDYREAGDRIHLVSASGERVTFFPPKGSKFNHENLKAR